MALAAAMSAAFAFITISHTHNSLTLIGLPLNRDEGILDLVTKGIVGRYLWWLNWAHAHGFFGGGGKCEVYVLW